MKMFPLFSVLFLCFLFLLLISADEGNGSGGGGRKPFLSYKLIGLWQLLQAVKFNLGHFFCRRMCIISVEEM